jgi:endonuclease/exonuclease/phosphatase (EEP) superfamily protein YafD
MEEHHQAILAICILFLVSVAIPFLKSQHWTVRVLDYPRGQKLVIGVVLIVACVLWRPPEPWGYLLLATMVLATAYLAYVVHPYTPLGRQIVQAVVPDAGENPLSLLVCNVLQSNRDYHRLAAVITERKPDVVFLLETDEAWRKGIQEAVKDYPHRIEVPQDDTYGLLFYSRLKLLHHSVEYLIEKEVPSIVADIEYRGRPVRLYGLHPTPPVPQENTESTERDAEVLLVGRKAKEYGKECIVFGDLNDVAWSATTKLFLKTSGLLDPRRGRGMYNTFHAGIPLLRWPLDHYFLSSQFRLVDMRIERNVGSDHFPISLSVVLRNDDDSGEMELSDKEAREVQEKIADGKASGDA